MNKMKIAAVMSAAAILMSGCAAGKGTEVAVVGDTKITSNDVSFFISDCSIPTDDHAKDVQDAVDTLVENAKIIQVAEKTDHGLSDEEKANLKSKIESVRKQYGGVKEFEKMLQEKGISDDFIENLLSVTTLKEKLTEALGTEFSDEDRKEYFNNNYYFANHILILTSDSETGEPYTDEQKADAEAKAKDILAQAQNSDDFDSLAAEYSEDPGNTANPKGYIFTDGDMVKEFEECVKSLQPGEVGLCETSYGYHVIKRYALDADQEYYDHNLFDAENAINTALTDQLLKERLDTWCEENGITTVIHDDVVEKLKAEPTPEPITSDNSTAD